MCGDRIGSIFKMRHLCYPKLPSIWPENFEEGKKLKHFFFHRYLPFSNNYQLTFVLCLNLKFRKESSWSNLRGCSSSSRFLHTHCLYSSQHHAAAQNSNRGGSRIRLNMLLKVVRRREKHTGTPQHSSSREAMGTENLKISTVFLCFVA